MISDAFLVYFIFQMILLMLALAGNKMFVLWYFGIIGTILSAIPTIIAFGSDFWMFAVFLIIVNIVTPVLGLAHGGKK